MSLPSTDVPAGERGELWLKGPNVMKVIQGMKSISVACWPFFLTVKGYINNPEATAECIDSEGYFHTGDIAIQDKNGHFFIVDRIKELIKFKGFQVLKKWREHSMQTDVDISSLGPTSWIRSPTGKRLSYFLFENLYSL